MRRWDLSPHPLPQAPTHVHDRGDEGFVVLRGLLDVTLGSEVMRLGPAELVVVAAGTAHTFATVGDVPASILVTMTPEIDALVRDLHQASEQERDAGWARYDSHTV